MRETRGQEGVIHLQMARIMSRFRSCTKATTLQELTLAHTYARQAAMELIKELDAESIDIGELEALLDDRIGELKDPVLPAPQSGGGGGAGGLVRSPTPPGVSSSAIISYISTVPPPPRAAEMGYSFIARGWGEGGGAQNWIIAYINSKDPAPFSFYSLDIGILSCYIRDH